MVDRLTIFFSTILLTAFIVTAIFTRNNEIRAASAIASTTTSTTEVTEVTTSSTTSTFPANQVSDVTTTTLPTYEPTNAVVDSCGRGTNYPAGWYQELTPQATPGDPMPDWRTCPDEYAAWAARQGALNNAVSHCWYDAEENFQWMWSDTSMSHFQEAHSGHRWVCVGTDPIHWVKDHGEPPYN